MDLKLLEQMRMRKIIKLFLLLVLNTIIMVASLFVVATKFNNGTLFALTLFAFIVIYAVIASIPKNFENEVKKALLPQLLKNIIKNDGQINWQGTEFEIDEMTPAEKIECALDDVINKRCSVTTNSEEDLEKYIDYLSEVSTLEEKDTLTADEEIRLKEIQAYLEEADEKYNAKETEKYNIRMEFLREFENKNLVLKEEDTIKIEYLKREIESYKESQELDKLLEKDENDLTTDEKSRKIYLQQKFDGQSTILRQRTEKLHKDIDRGLCLFHIFNNSISYDDVFYGNYKGIEFVTIEGKEEKIFNGTVIRIPLEKEFDNTLLILNKAFNTIPLNGVVGLQQDLHSIKLQNFNKHTIWAKEPEELDQIIDDNFIRYVNNQNTKFSYMFKEEFAYLIWPHQKDFFKLGSLFKKVDNKKQYMNFEKDIKFMLSELEKFALSINKN